MRTGWRRDEEPQLDSSWFLREGHLQPHPPSLEQEPQTQATVLVMMQMTVATQFPDEDSFLVFTVL